MKRTITLILAGAAAVYPAAADIADGGCPYAGSYGMMGGWGWFGGGLLGLLYVALAALIFALVFWGVKKLMMENKQAHHARKKK